MFCFFRLVQLPGAVNFTRNFSLFAESIIKKVTKISNNLLTIKSHNIESKCCITLFFLADFLSAYFSVFYLFVQFLVFWCNCFIVSYLVQICQPCFISLFYCFPVWFFWKTPSLFIGFVNLFRLDKKKMTKKFEKKNIHLHLQNVIKVTKVWNNILLT